MPENNFVQHSSRSFPRLYLGELCAPDIKPVLEQFLCPEYSHIETATKHHKRSLSYGLVQFPITSVGMQQLRGNAR